MGNKFFIEHTQREFSYSLIPLRLLLSFNTIPSSAIDCESIIIIARRT
jgi:hypothetical protein